MVPPSYTFDIVLQELEDFFGGAITLQSRERSLTVLRQTGTVSELAIAFQTITNAFRPRWSDHPLIYALPLPALAEVQVGHGRSALVLPLVSPRLPTAVSYPPSQ